MIDLDLCSNEVKIEATYEDCVHIFLFRHTKENFYLQQSGVVSIHEDPSSYDSER